jgi:hypothetical protein
MTEDVRPDYFATDDPLDPSKLSYWYRPKRGRRAGEILPWPPRRNRWGILLRAVVLEVPLEQRDDYRIAHWKRVREGREIVKEMIRRDPVGAAARFAAAQSICCCCGKALTDERSRAYGIGPDCRQGVKPEVLAELIEWMEAAHAGGRVSWRDNSRDDPALFDAPTPAESQ